MKLLLFFYKMLVNACRFVPMFSSIAHIVVPRPGTLRPEPTVSATARDRRISQTRLRSDDVDSSGDSP